MGIFKGFREDFRISFYFELLYAHVIKKMINKAGKETVDTNKIDFDTWKILSWNNFQVLRKKNWVFLLFIYDIYIYIYI